MASRSDSGNETRGSSESDNSPTPTKEIKGSRNRFSSPKQRIGPSLSSSSTTTTTPVNTPSNVNQRALINTRTTPISRTTPTTRPFAHQQQPHGKFSFFSHRLTPTTQSRTPSFGPLRTLQRRTPSGTNTSSGVIHPHSGSTSATNLAPLLSNRGRQRNSVAVVDSRDHIYEELDVCRGPPKIAPVSGVLPQGKVVIRPIAFKPVVPQGSSQNNSSTVTSGSQETTKVSCNNGFEPLEGRPDPRYTSTPMLMRGQIQHYGSMGDLKTLGQNSSSSSYSLDRRGLGLTTSTRNYFDPYSDPGNNKNDTNNNKNKANAKYISSSYVQGSHPPVCPSYGGVPHHSGRERRTPPVGGPVPPRPPSHQSVCSTLDDSPPGGSRFSSFDTSRTPSSSAGFSSRSTSGYESSPPAPNPHGSPGSSSDYFMRSGSTSTTMLSQPRLHHDHHQRMGGSVSNLTRLGHHGTNVPLHNGPMTGSNLCLDRSLSVTGSNLVLDRSVGSIRGSLNELRLGGDSRHHPLHHQTPSPSDSGVAELEAMLKEKDSEINNLKETMEQNEQVVFKVYEEKEKTWERELKKIRDMYDSRLKTAQQKALKVEQSLSTQTYQLQQERRKVSAELEEVKRERDGGSKQVEQLKKEVSSLRAQLEETEWSLCQKSGEISLLKTQLKDSHGDQTTRGHELLHLRAKVRQYQQEVERRRAEVSSLHDLTTQLRRENTDLRTQVDQNRQSSSQDHDELSHALEETRLNLEAVTRERDAQRSAFEEDKSRWMEEKERVIQYQKQLHHNYLSTLTRNRQLEEEVARLTGVPLPPTPVSSASNGIPPAIPPLPSYLPPLPSYSEIRDSSISVNAESRC